MPDFVKHSLVKENLVENRLYQEVLVARALEKGNTLIVAPTALGKTIVAGRICASMLQKFPEKKILLLSPTKPLAVQHQNTLKKILNMDEEKIVLMTGTIAAKNRREIWNNAAIISATPQTIENDIITGKLSLKEVSLCVFDECHRAVGDYSYVFIAQQYVKQCPEPFILALTASPGSTQEKIQEVCNNLFIKKFEIKNEKDIDVKPYTHNIESEWITVELPAEFLEIKVLLEKFIRENLSFLKKIGYSMPTQYLRKKDLLIMQSRIIKDMHSKGKQYPYIFQGVSKLSAILKVSHAQTLLETQGIIPLAAYFEKMEIKSTQSGSPKSLKQIFNDEHMVKAISLTKKLAEEKILHPKIAKLKEILQKQFHKNPESRIIVFNHYRDSVSNLVKEINYVEGVKSTKFIGQATKESDKGMSQKEQIQTIKDLEEGKVNVLVASSVAEEGLDIPAVDLVIFYEPVPSEIRTIQRRGRTGRLSNGKAIILMAKGTRDEAFYWSSKRKEKKMHSTLKGMKELAGDIEKENSKKLEQQTTLSSYSENEKDKIIVYVDTREQASSVAKNLIEKNVFIKIKQLEVGDYILSNEVVVERKTTEDFITSMLDGRLFNQLVSMAENYSKPLMLVEGNQEELYSLRNVHKNAIIGALTSIALNYRIPVIFTKDDSETAEFIYVIAKREQLGKETEIKLRIGRRGLTLPEQQQFIIESLPLVGPVTARALLDAFGSVKNIINAPLEELQKVENIGPIKAQKIKKVLEEKYKIE